MSVITFSNQKGGVAKTTSAIMTSACLVSRGKKILIVDADPQCNSSAFAIDDFASIVESKKSLFDLIFDDKVAIEEAIVNDTEFGDVMIGSRKLWDMDRSDADPLVLKEIIDDVKGYYDYVVIDTPPNLGWLQLASLYASDYVVIPTDADNLAVQNIPYLFNTIKNVQKQNIGLKVAGILFTRIESRLGGTAVEKYIMDDVKQYGEVAKINVFDGFIRMAKAPLGKSSLSHTNMFKQKSFHKVRTDYENFVNQLLGVIE